MINKFKHQGDVTFSPVKTVEGKEVNHNGSFVLALGETTGHEHVITVERPEQMQVFREENGRVYLNLTGVGTITHEEHLPIILPPGKYRVGGEREVDWFSKTTRQVID